MMLGSSELHTAAAEARRVGASYVSKPINETELAATIYRALGHDQSAGPRESARVEIARSVRRLRILLAEDNAVNQRIAVRLLEKMGHEAVVAVNGLETVLQHAASAFDLILMDVQMPEMSGFEATQHIREREKSTGEHIRIIALTAHAIEGDRERCLSAGMDDYMSKPLDASLLAEKLEAFGRSFDAMEPPTAEIPSHLLVQ
jgi:CheY-like chemotaxis protein